MRSTLPHREITIAYLARVNGIPPGTISLNIKVLLNGIPELKKQMRNKSN